MSIITDLKEDGASIGRDALRREVQVKTASTCLGCLRFALGWDWFDLLYLETNSLAKLMAA
jgi:hypothetical protein